MLKQLRRSAVICAVAALPANTLLLAQGTLDDYNRAYALREKYSSKHIFNNAVSPTWVSDTHFWYVRNTPDGQEYVLIDAARRTRSLLFDRDRLADRLSTQTGNTIDARYLPLHKCRLTPNCDTLRFAYDRRLWRYAISNDHLISEGNEPAPRKGRHWMERDDERDGAPVTSPDGQYAAYIRADNLFVRNTQTGQETQLTTDGTPDNYYSCRIHWSPDSRKVAACRISPTGKRYVYYVESSPADQLQPRLHKQEYAKPGDELPFKTPCIFHVKTGQALVPETTLFDRQYELHSLRWDADSKSITFEYNERGHKVYRLLEMSAADGRVRALVDEQEEKYVNYPLIFRHHLADGKRLIWSSERDNYNHLYLYDRTGDQPARQITKGPWYVREVQHVDEKNRQIYFSASGMDPDTDPYFIHYYRIGFDGRGLKELTPGTGMHRAWFSAGYDYVVDVYSTPDTPPVSVLRDTRSGKIIMELERADISRLLAAGWTAPETFCAKGRDGETDIWGIIYRPSNFDPTRKYPVIEYIYSGPGNQYVPKTFISYNWYITSLAELGFIVVQVDGMTTSFRSKTFEEVCYKNLKDAGLPDHIAWIKAAAEKYPYMDLERVGIFGCSAGGQESTAAMLFHPDFYKAAYSACGCHDNRMDKIWWNELWMGYPVDDSYKQSSNVENAHRLQGALMLVVGEMDDNVDPASTMQLANALIKANKDFELIVLPGARHTMGDDYGEHKRYDFFVRELLHVEPPRWDQITY